MQLKPLPERRVADRQNGLTRGQHHGRTLDARRYLELCRRPPLSDLPARRPPYLEAAVTAAAFIFLLYLILGGA
jgi:hypothetical protein